MEDRETARMRKYGESKTTRIMMATVPHVNSGLGLRKFQADRFLLTRVYVHIDRFTVLVIYHWTCDWINSQVVNVFVVGPVQLFLFRGFQVGVYIPLVGCALLFPCVFTDYLPAS